MRPRSDDRSDSEIALMHARYLAGESVADIGRSLPRPMNAAMVYYHFARLGLKLKSGRPPSGIRLPENRRTGPIVSVDDYVAPVKKRPFAGPPIYRSDFIRGDAERKMRAGR